MQKYFWCIGVALCSLPVWAEEEGLRSLDRFYLEVETFQAKFEQLVMDEDGVSIDRAEGQVWIQRPGRFRWDYAPPDAQEIVGDGEKLWIHDIELEQVTVRDQEQVLGRTPAILLAGEGGYRTAYEVQAGGEEQGLDWVELLPREEEGGFTQIRIAFKGSKFAIMELQDSLGQTTRIDFFQGAENEFIEPGRFRFVPPEDVDIIDESKF